MQTAELDLAIEEYTETIALDSQDAKAYNDRGVAYYYKGDLEQAIADYDQAIAIDPQLALAYRNRAAAYAMTGQYDRALADCDKVLELDPANATVYWFRGLVHKVIGEREEAIAAISQRDLRSSNGAGPCAWVPHSAILLPQLAQQRPCVALGNLATVISIQHPCCFSKGGWPQAVPGGGDFVIEARVNALIAGCEQLAACLSQGNGGCYKAYSHSVLRNPICPE
jgi:tetratricopeptide (TPR) repeat protein